MSFSVLLSVYSKENPCYLNEALSSIWDQQTLKPGQIVLVKDGPLTEELDSCINIWIQKLGEILTIVELPLNAGLGVALNEGLKQCRYELVARMDADDISLPKRFEKQVAFMEENPDIAASSAVLEEWDLTFEKYIGIRALPLKPEELEKFAKYRCPLSHPVAIFRKSIVLKVGGYPAFRRAQDYPLWSVLLVNGYKLANLPDVLYKQRAGNALLKRRGLSHFKNELKIFNCQRKIKFINIYEYLRNIIIRLIIRIVPNFIKRFFYKYRNIRKYQFLIAFVDIIFLLLAVSLSVWLRYLEFPSTHRLIRLYPQFIPIIAAWIVCFYFAGFYSLEIPRIGYRLLSNLSIIAVICTLLSFGYFYLNIEFQRGPRTILIIYSFNVTILILLWRLFLNRIAVKYTARINVGFVGINDTVINLLQDRQNNSRMKYNMIFLYDENHTQADEYSGVPVIRDASVLIDAIKKNKVQIIAFAEDMKLSKSMQNVLFEFINYNVKMINIPVFYELFTRRLPLDAINEMGLLSNFNMQLKKIYAIFKRIIDILMAFILFILSLPLWPLIILLIKLESPGTAFLKQECIGYLGQPFTLVKFRTIKILNDRNSQITRIGNFLYKTNMDRFPQLMNVIKSNMSFIGPRPEEKELILEIEKEVPFYRQRLLVKPGISGWDQVSDKYHLLSKEDIYKKLQYDLYYIKNMSFFLDASIFFKTLVTIVKRSGK